MPGRLQHLIIDGFNVIFGDPLLRESFSVSQEQAKEMLIRLTRELHDQEGMHVTVVFDGKGDRLQVEHPLRSDTFTVIHSPSQLSADGVIERMLARSRYPDRITVVSNDHMIRDAAIANGASFQAAEAFMNWMGGLRSKKPETQKAKDKTSNTLQNRLLF